MTKCHNIVKKKSQTSGKNSQYSENKSQTTDKKSQTSDKKSQKCKFKGTAMQIEKALINDHLSVSKVS